MTARMRWTTVFLVRVVRVAALACQRDESLPCTLPVMPAEEVRSTWMPGAEAATLPPAHPDRRGRAAARLAGP